MDCKAPHLAYLLTPAYYEDSPGWARVWRDAYRQQLQATIDRVQARVLCWMLHDF